MPPKPKQTSTRTSPGLSTAAPPVPAPGRTKSVRKSKPAADAPPSLPQPTPADTFTPATSGSVPAVPMALFFDRPFYERTNPDVLDSGMDPATHYFVYGYKERRAPNPLFDPNAYLRANPDLSAFDGDLFLHYIFYGVTEGRPIA
jgi:hypothetical protein